MHTKKPPLILQERDLHLFRELSVMRVFDRAQARIAGRFGSDSRTNRRLAKLTRAGFLRRFYVGRKGIGATAFYSLTKLGAWTADVEYRSPRRGRDEVLFTDFFTEHQLAINEIYLQLKYGLLPEGIVFKRWIAFREHLAPSVHLIPDGYAEIETPHERVASFVEVDLGNEHLRVWQKKVQEYLHLAISERFNELFALKRFRVIVLVNSLRRLMSLRKATAPITSKVFFFATVEEVRRHGFFGVRWFRPTGAERQALTQ